VTVELDYVVVVAAPTVTSLAADNSVATAFVPTNVFVPRGQTQIRVDVPTLGVSEDETVKMVAEDDGVVLFLEFVVAPAALVELEIAPARGPGGKPLEGTVQLSGRAPPTGAIVRLSASDTAVLSVPAEIVVAPGQSEARFPAFSRATATTTAVSCQASLGKSKAEATLTITPPSIDRVELLAEEVAGGNEVEGAVVLDGPAPSGGVLVRLQSSDPLVARVPARVTIAAGADRATFTVATSPSDDFPIAAVSASFGGTTRLAALTVLSPAVIDLGVAPRSAVGGRRITGRVVIDGNAGKSGAVVELGSSRPDLATVPRTVLVAPGSNTASFEIETRRVARATEVIFEGSLGGVTIDGAVTLVPARLGDSDGDGDVDIGDFAAFQACFSPERVAGGAEDFSVCRDAFDFDVDSDIDHSDYVVLESKLVGDAGGLARVHVELDQRIVPSVDSLPAASDGGSRPVAAMVDSKGAQSEFVETELIVEARDQRELSAFLRRWNGEVIGTLEPAEFGLDLAPQHLVRVETAGAEIASLGDILTDASGGLGGYFRVSSESGMRLLGIAAVESAGGAIVGVNWVGRGSDIRRGTTREHPTGSIPGYTPDAFQWGPLTTHGVPEAWRLLDLAGRLGNKVPVAVIDFGFAADADLLPGRTVFGIPLGTQNSILCGTAACPWHGTNVTNILAGQVDNSFGGAGVAGPVAAAPLTIHTPGDFFGQAASVLTAYGAGARITNISIRTLVPASMFWSVYLYDTTTDLVRRNGMLVFAAAGNDGLHVDEEDCAGICWEETWVAPCENDGVICVGGVNPDGATLAAGSNYGDEDVDLYAPYTVIVGPDPAPGNSAPRSVSGTSFSSPYAAGVAALVWAANPGLDANGVVDVLHRTARGLRGGDGDIVHASSAVLFTLGSLPPTIEILSPRDGGTYPDAFLGSAIGFHAVTSDREDGELEATWTSSLQGEIGRGNAINLHDLVPGTHTIFARVTDSTGITGEDRVTIRVNAVGPEIHIVRPFNQSHVNVGEEVLLRARSLDRAGASFRLPDSSIVWTSSLEGTLGTGHDVPVFLFEAGTHTITVRGTDARGATGVASITLVVDPPVEDPLPSVEILTPATDFTFEWDRTTLWNDCFKELQLDARATDNVTQEPIPDERISWHTDRKDLQDPFLGSGRNPFVGLFMSDCETTTQHVITCTVTDSRGNSRTSEPRRIRVRPVPH
jgi:serine protease